MFQDVLSVISTIASCILVLQVCLLKHQIQMDQERSRRENTSKALLAWSNSIRRETSAAEAIVEKLSFEQCQKLYSRTSVPVDQDILDLVLEICPNADTSNGCIQGEALNFIRWHVISYLNLLESILTYWKLNIVDRKVFESEFSFLYNETKGWNFLANMRKAADGYPIIDEFLNELMEIHQKSNNPGTFAPLKP